MGRICTPGAGPLLRRLSDLFPLISNSGGRCVAPTASRSTG